jgi:hypothetical protein
MLTISNIYGHGYGHAQIERLRSLGFRIRDQVSTFAGSQLLRFVDFAEPPALEFIEVEDESAYAGFLPSGMVAYCPGINLLIPQDSSKVQSDYEQSYQAWGPYSLHVNYDGSEESDRPGWNYLNFDVPVVRDTFIYLTEMDDPRPVRRVETDHPNTAKRVTGLVFDLDETDLAKLANLVGAEMVGGQFDLGGVQIWASNAAAGNIKIPEKRFPLAAIIIEAESMEFFRVKDRVRATDFLSRPAAHIKTTEFSWDLIVTT